MCLKMFALVQITYQLCQNQAKKWIFYFGEGQNSLFKKLTVLKQNDGKLKCFRTLLISTILSLMWLLVANIKMLYKKCVCLHSLPAFLILAFWCHSEINLKSILSRVKLSPRLWVFLSLLFEAKMILPISEVHTSNFSMLTVCFFLTDLW